MKKISSAFVLMLLLFFSLNGCSSKPKDAKMSVRVLILPKFEVDELSGDFPGEAQLFYEAYLSGGDVYDIDGCPEASKLYYKNGVAMCIVGQGKVNAAISTSAVLSDERFDLTDAYILDVGCGGAAEGYGILGDVFVISAAVDYDLGHHADPREMHQKTETTWFHDESFDDGAVVMLDSDLMQRVFEMVEGIPLETTEKTVRFLAKEYPGEAWADRPPQVKRGTSLSSDNYWKGAYDHQNALLITETYGCIDPYAVSEMEDIAVGLTARRFGMLDHLIILRVGVNMDVFPTGMTPEMLWGEATDDHIAAGNSMESVDIFETGMKNCFDTGKIVIDAILEGRL